MSESESFAQAPTWSRTIVYHASRDALGPRTDVILSRLGYQMLMPETLEKLRAENPEIRPEMLIVDERRIDEVEAYDSASGSLPIILLTGQQGAPLDDPRIRRAGSALCILYCRAPRNGAPRSRAGPSTFRPMADSGPSQDPSNL